MGSRLDARITRGALLALSGILAGTATGSPDAAGTSAPYPPSSVIAGVEFEFTTHDERAPGSDNWPITWSDDGHQYTAWGDGGGFGGTNSKGRVSLGVARVEGEADDYQGFNVWGGFEPENVARFEGKSYGILSVGGVLYMWWGPGSGTTSYSQTRLAVSFDRSATWTLSDWDLTETDDRLIMPTILNFGQDYGGARDRFVYHYFIRREPTGSGLGIHRGGEPPTGKIDLARVPTDSMLDLSTWVFFTGLDGNGDPQWSADAGARVPVFEDPNGVGWNCSVSYNPGLGRYLLATEHTASIAGRMGLFDASEPWGPWTTVAYYDDPPFGDGDTSATTFFWNFANKWLSANGLDFTMIFTGTGSNDSWNSVAGTFAPAALFADGFESGDTAAWSTTVP